MRSYIGIFVGVALGISGSVFLTSCGAEDTPNLRIITAQAGHAIDLSLPAHVDVALPASFTVTGKSIESAITPQNVLTIDQLKPEYALALATDALNFTEVRRRT